MKAKIIKGNFRDRSMNFLSSREKTDEIIKEVNEIRKLTNKRRTKQKGKQ